MPGTSTSHIFQDAREPVAPVPFIDIGSSSGRHARCHERPAHTISRAIRHGPVSLLHKVRGQMMLTTRQL